MQNRRWSVDLLLSIAGRGRLTLPFPFLARAICTALDVRTSAESSAFASLLGARSCLNANTILPFCIAEVRGSSYHRERHQKSDEDIEHKHFKRRPIDGTAEVTLRSKPCHDMVTARQQLLVSPFSAADIEDHYSLKVHKATSSIVRISLPKRCRQLSINYATSLLLI